MILNVSCTKGNIPDSVKDSSEIVDSEIKVENELGHNDLQDVIKELTMIIESKNYNDLSSFVHKSRGVRFSNYGMVDVKTNIVLTSEEISRAANNDVLYDWGVYVNSEEPIRETIDEYFDSRFSKHKYSEADVMGVDEKITDVYTNPDFAKETYPNAKVVEFYFNYNFPESLDWQSVKLILENIDGQYYLVGVIHTFWTP